MSSLWDVWSKMDLIQMMPAQITYLWYVCERAVKSELLSHCLFFSKYGVFHCCVSRKKDSVVFSAVTDICVTHNITINDWVLSFNMSFIRHILNTIQVYGFCTLISIIFTSKMKKLDPWARKFCVRLLFPASNMTGHVSPVIMTMNILLLWKG